MGNNIYSFYYAKKKKNKLSLLFLLCIILCVFLLLFTILHFFANGNSFKAKSYYFFSTDKTTDKKQVEYLQKLCTDAGGAGYIYFKNGEYNIIAFIYLSEVEANNVVNENKEHFKDANLKQLVLPKLSNKKIKLIKSNIGSLKPVEFIDSIVNKLYDLYKKNNSSLDRAYSYTELSKLKNKCDEYIKFVEQFKVLEIQIINEYLNVFYELINSCLQDLYTGTGLLKAMSKLIVSVAFSEYEFRNSINS